MSFEVRQVPGLMLRKGGFDLGGDGWGNHEFEDYTDQPDNVHLDGSGYLVITA
jgi:hypothetical protein